MATVTHVCTIEYVAKMLGEDLEMLEAIIENDDNLSYGTIIRVHSGSEEAWHRRVERHARRRTSITGRMARLPQGLHRRSRHHCPRQGKRAAVETVRLPSNAYGER